MNSEPLITLLTTVAAGVLTAIASVFLALRKFRTERWWERKAQAYSDLFVALFNVQRSLRVQIDREETGAQYNEDFLGELRLVASAGHVEVRKAAAIGTFIFNRATSTRLEKLVSQLDDSQHDVNFYEELCDNLDAVTSALEDLKSCRRRTSPYGSQPNGRECRLLMIGSRRLRSSCHY